MKPGWYAYSTTGTPQLILFLGEDSLPPSVTLRLIRLQLQTVPVLVVYFALAVRAHVQAWPCLLLVYFFLVLLLLPFLLLERIATVAAWVVT